MKKGVTLIYTILFLTLLVSQEAKTNSERPQEFKRIFKETGIDTVHSLADSLRLYVCRIDSANDKSKKKVRILKRNYKELEKLDSILITLNP